MKLYFEPNEGGKRPIIDIDLDAGCYVKNLNPLRGFKYRGKRPVYLTLTRDEFSKHGRRKDFHVLIHMCTKPDQVFVQVR